MVMLIDENGNKLGHKTKEEALKSSSELNLDLVQVSPSGAEPVVCKIMDFGKHIFMKKKNNSSSKAGSKRTTTKEIKFRPSTDVGDYNIKLKNDKKLYSWRI